MTEFPPRDAARDATATAGTARVRDRIPVLRPRLPAAERLLPYLRRADATRTYSNYGPLVVELERRLERHFGLDDGTAVSASSGLSAIVGAILATAGRATAARPLAAVPAYTFVGTAVAVEQCGYVPLLVDVDPGTWQLDAAALAAHPRRDEIGLAVPVAPYGLPVAQAPWQAFRAATGIEVVIDAAAAFDTLDAATGVGVIPVALSFHATKSFATGEGGAVFCADRALALAVTRALNFGFYADRNSRGPSSNGKMSEYHAAVGLAELDGWEGKRAEMHAVAAMYREHLAHAGLADRFHGAPRIGANYALFDCGDDAGARRVEQALAGDEVDWRRWYGDALHRQEHFAAAPRDRLPVSEALAARLLGIPTAPDLPPAHVARIAAAIARGLAAGA